MKKLHSILILFIMLLWASAAYPCDTKHKYKFRDGDKHKYNLSHSDRVKIKNGKLHLIGCSSDGVHPYVEIKGNAAPRFLRTKNLKQYGKHIKTLRYCLSRDTGNTWWYFDPDQDKKKWIPSDGSYEQSTSYDLTKVNFGTFRRELAHRVSNRWKEVFVIRIYVDYPNNYCKTETDIDNGDTGVVTIDSVEVDVDDNREPANVIVSTETVYTEILVTDTVIQKIHTRDTIVNTVVRTDTVTNTVRDTVMELDTVTNTIVMKDTVIQRDTVIHIIVERDTVNQTDTVVQVDTLIYDRVVFDTVSVTDTLVQRDTIPITIVQYDTVNTITHDTLTKLDTVVVHDTVHSTIVKQDTIVKMDTVIQIVVERDTVNQTDTVIKRDTIINTVVEYQTVTQTDTVVQRDTITNTIVETDTVVLTEIVHDTVYQEVVRTDTIVKEVLPYPDYDPDCDTCKPVCGAPVVCEAGDPTQLIIHAFNDSGEYLGPQPWPQEEEDECENGGCGQPFTPTEALDSIVQVGPWYYHLIVKPNVMIKINIYVMIENNLIELRNFKTNPGDTLILVAVAEDSFGNQIGEVEVDWFATGDSAGATGIGAFVGDKSGSRTSIVAGPSLGQLGIRYAADTLITADGVSIETIVMTFPVANVVVRDSCCGGGNAVNSLLMEAGDTLSLYVAAYDSNGEYITDLAVWWDGGGVVKDHIKIALNNSLLVNPEQAGTGFLKMTYQSGTNGQKITVIVEVEVTVSTAYRLEIRTGPNGTGTLLDSIESDVFTPIGQILDLYASVVDENGNHICDTVVEWTASAVVGTKLWSNSGDHLRLYADSLRTMKISAGLDGFDTTETDTITVVKGAKFIQIRNQSGGGGDVMSGLDDTMTVDVTLPLYAAAYDSSDEYIADVTVNWYTSDTAQGIGLRTTNQYIYNPSKPGSGKITAILNKDTAAGEEHLKDSTGTIKVNAGSPARLVIQEEPVAVAVDSTFNFTVKVTDRAGNELAVSPIGWLVEGTGSISAYGQYKATLEGSARVIAAYGAIRDTTPDFNVVDGVPLTNAGDTITFSPEGVTMGIPAQAGLNGHVVDVDYEPETMALADFVRVRGPFDFEDCSKEYFAEALFLTFDYTYGFIDTLATLGKSKSDIRVYGYNRGAGRWEAMHGAINDSSLNTVTIWTSTLHSKYVLGVDLQDPLVSVTIPDTINSGSNMNVTCAVADNMPNCKVYISYKEGDAEAYEVDSTTLSSGTDTVTVTIPGYMVGYAGIAIEVKVTDGHAVVYGMGDGSGSSDPQLVSPVIQISNAVYPQAIPETTWVLLSLPYQPSVTSPKEFFSNYGTYGKHWLLATVIDNQLVGYDTTTDNFKMEVCRLYWFATGAIGAIIRIPTGYAVPVTDTFEFKVPPKQWVGCGVPFGFPVAVRDIRKATGADSVHMRDFMYVKSDGSGWGIANADSLLRPWVGYYQYNASDDTITIKFPPVQMENPPAAKILARGENEWRFGVQATVGEYKDSEKFFGNLEGRNGWYYTTPMPPKFPGQKDMLQLSFKRQGAAYFTDYRNSNSGSVWNAEISEMNKAAGVRMNFRHLGEPNEKVKLVVIDPVRKLYFDVTENMEYCFVTDGKSKRMLKVVAGDQAFVAGQVVGLKAVPLEFALSQNYPNPFNPVTSIKFAVPNTLTGTDDLPGAEWASLRIYNMRGQLVAVPFHTLVQAGYYTVNWNAKDRTGKPCATGNYVYRLNVGDKFSKNLRMSLLK